MDQKNHSLMLQEVPLHSLSSRRPQEISVIEGPESVSSRDGVDFPESGGGISVQLHSSIRNICWRTHHNVLEIFEYSLDTDLYGSSYIVTFEGSRVLPWVHVVFVKKQLHIACCTLHAMHNIVLDVTNMGKTAPKSGKPHPSLLCNLGSFDFGNTMMNCYFKQSNVQGEMVSWTAVTIASQTSNRASLAAAVMTSQGNLNLIKMRERRSPSVAIINQSSRMSRMLAGINPWADAGGTETILDMKIASHEGQAFIVAICCDKKLRIWSFETHDMMFSHDISHHILDEDEKEKKPNCKITFCQYSGLISIFIEASDRGFFLQYKIEIESDGRVACFDNLSVTTAPLIVHDGVYRHLVDFNISCNVLTTLWRDVEENDVILACEADVGVWHEVAVYPNPIQEVPLLPYKDVRESYMDYIFFPGRFSPAAIARSLMIRRRVPSTVLMSLGYRELKEKVATHIQSEIQEIIPEEGADDDAIQLAAWNNFFQNLVQYQQVVSRAVGLSVIPKGIQCPMSVIKKGGLSVLAPVSVLESVCRGCNPRILKEALLRSEPSVVNNLDDVGKLLENLGNLHAYLGVELLDSIQQSIRFSGNSPLAIVADLIPEIVSSGNDGPGDIFEGITDVDTAIRMLLDSLEPVDSGSDLDIPDIQSWPAGTQGIEVISRCTACHLENRFQLSILLAIALSISENLPRGQDAEQEQDSQLVSRTVAYIQAYKALVWVSSAMTQNVSQGAMEIAQQTLTLHDANLGISNSERTKGKISPASGDRTVLEYFISGEGGKLLQGLVQVHSLRRKNQLLIQRDVVRISVDILVYLIWPWGPTLALQDFLLNRGQFAVLQKYLQGELRQWCNWCPKSREYMLGHCHLNAGDYRKAVKSFIFASSGIGFEEYLGNKLLRDDEENLHPLTQEIIYFTKILPIFEKLDLSEEVIILAQQAIESTKMHERHQNLPILWSSVFRQSNSLRRHEDALKAIILNPDSDHKKDCLRSLAVSLCERKEYRTLVEFQYAELEGDMADILEHRARGTDLSTSQHNYYDLLYAFHIQRGNHRKAASAMYEQAYRIGCEFSPSTSEGNIRCLQKQSDCYAACINCLYLVDEENRWILHPIRNHGKVGSTKPQGYTSPKRHNDGEVRQRQRSRVVIHELADVEKESMMVEMKMKLEGMPKESSVSLGPLASAVEVSSVLSHAGLYDDAIALSHRFDLPLAPIFSSLAAKCVRLSFLDDKGVGEAWEWLHENETVKTHCKSGLSSIGQWTAADAAYRLLQVYLERHGNAPDRGTSYYYASAKALLGLNATLPAWFVDIYKTRNCPELLRLLVLFDRLEEATMLAVEMINLAKLNIGTEFDVNTNSRRSACLPYAILEQLLEILEDMRAQDEFDQLYEVLSKTLDGYLTVAETVSESIINAHLLA